LQLLRHNFFSPRFQRPRILRQNPLANHLDFSHDDSFVWGVAKW
jgi:hypothetical protein